MTATPASFHLAFQLSVTNTTHMIHKLILELKLDVLARQLSVDGGESGELVLDLLLALSTEEHLDVVSVRARDVGVLADALARVHQIVDDGVVHSGQSVSVRTLALELVGTAVVLGQNGSLGNEHNGATLELLLQLRRQAGLDHAESLEQLVGHEHNNGLLVSLDLDLLGSGHLEGLQRLSKILGLLGDLSDLVGNSNLKVSGLDAFGLQNHFHGLQHKLELLPRLLTSHQET